MAFPFDAPNLRPAINAQNKALAQNSKRRKEALGFIDTATGQAQPYLEQGQELFDPILSGNMDARAMYLNSLGLNGEEGNQAALDAFSFSPGHDIAAEAVLRKNAALGGVASGNTMGDLHGLGMLEYGNWQNRLAGLDPMAPASAKYSGLTNLANLFTNAGSNKASINTNFAGQQLQGANSLTGLMTQNANNQAAANNMLPQLLIQGGLNALGGFFGA